MTVAIDNKTYIIARTKTDRILTPAGVVSGEVRPVRQAIPVAGLLAYESI
jgi:hypothetical protein